MSFQVVNLSNILTHVKSPNVFTVQDEMGCESYDDRIFIVTYTIDTLAGCDVWRIYGEK